MIYAIVIIAAAFLLWPAATKKSAEMKPMNLKRAEPKPVAEKPKPKSRAKAKPKTKGSK